MPWVKTFLPPASVGQGEGNTFSLCVSSHLGGRGGGTPVRQWGYHLPRSRWVGGGVKPSQVRMRGYPFPGQEGGTAHPDLRRGTPIGKMGYLHPDLGRGYPYPDLEPRQGEGGTPNRNRIARTCYVAAGMPLVFTKEDFLVEYLLANFLFFFLSVNMSIHMSGFACAVATLKNKNGKIPQLQEPASIRQWQKVPDSHRSGTNTTWPTIHRPVTPTVRLKH